MSSFPESSTHIPGLGAQGPPPSSTPPPPPPPPPTTTHSATEQNEDAGSDVSATSSEFLAALREEMATSPETREQSVADSDGDRAENNSDEIVYSAPGSPRSRNSSSEISSLHFSDDGDDDAPLAGRQLRERRHLARLLLQYEDRNRDLLMEKSAWVDERGYFRRKDEQRDMEYQMKYDEMNENHEMRISNLEKEHASMKTLAAEKDVSLARYHESQVKMTKEIEEYKVGIRDLESRIHETTATKEQALNDGDQMAEQIAELTTQVRQLTTTKDSLMTEAREKVQQLEARNESLIREANHKVLELEARNDSTIDAARNKVGQLEAQNQSTTKDAEAKIRQLEDSRLELEATIEKASNEAQDTIRQLEAKYEKSVTEAQEKIRDLDSRGPSTTRDSEDRIRTLEALNESTTKQAKEKVLQLEDDARLREQVADDMKSKNAALEEQKLAIAQDAAKKMSELEEQVRAKDKAAEEMKKQMSDLEHKHLSVTGDANKTVSDLNATADARDKAADEMKARIAELKTGQKTVELEEAVRSHKKAKQEAESKLAELEARHAAEVQEADEKYTKLEVKYQSYWQRTQGDVAGLRAKFRDEEHEKSKAESRAIEVELDLQRVQNESRTLGEKGKQALKDLERAEAQSAALEREATAAKSEALESHILARGLRSELEASRGDVRALEAEKDKLGETETGVRVALDAARQDNAAAAEKLRGLEETEASLLLREAQVATLEARVEALLANADSLEQELTSASATAVEAEEHAAVGGSGETLFDELEGLSEGGDGPERSGTVVATAVETSTQTEPVVGGRRLFPWWALLVLVVVVAAMGRMLAAAPPVWLVQQAWSVERRLDMGRGLLG